MHPGLDYFKKFAVFILALGNLPGYFFFLLFSISSTKSKMVAKILCHSLELELLHLFVSCLVQRKDLTLDVCCLVSGVILIIKTSIFLCLRILMHISVLLIFNYVFIFLANFKMFDKSHVTLKGFTDLFSPWPYVF